MILVKNIYLKLVKVMRLKRNIIGINFALLIQNKNISKLN